MKDTRSASQVLFGFLPEQTVDMQGGVWKVKDWRRPIFLNSIDEDALRRELVRQASPWRAAGLDGGFVRQLEGGAKVTVVTVDSHNGVEVEAFPRIWVCKSCNRLYDSPEGKCKCGASGKTNLFFVGYHQECGAMREPWIPKCRLHGERRVRFPGTASASEIIFDCPVCKDILRVGFGKNTCDCGKGNLMFQPHRSSSVYTPRSAVIVNPPSKERVRAITGAGGPPKALSWVLDGMRTPTVETEAVTLASLRQTLAASGLAPEVVEAMVAAAAAKGDIEAGSFDFDAGQGGAAEAEAATIALATLESRVRYEDLVAGHDPASELGVLYRERYPEAFDKAGLFAVDLIEKFPVLTGVFGYTRGDHAPGSGRLVPYKGAYTQYILALPRRDRLRGGV